MATKKKANKAKKASRKVAKPRRAVAAKKAKATPRKAAAKRPVRRTPESLRLRSVAPSLVAADLQRSLAWYRDVLGFILEQEWKNDDGTLGGVTLKAGTTTFMISQDDWAKGRDRVKGVGFRLYCITVQDIDKLAAGIEARGGTLASRPTTQPWGMRDFTVVDPDGFRISISSPR
jgi:uncharacterized glyoxalase superfamily protein PhnB